LILNSFGHLKNLEMKHRKIRVNAISPGPIDTPMTSSMVQSEELGEQLKINLVNAVPLGRIGNTDEVSKAASFLASDDSSCTNNNNILLLPIVY
jgi:NAD(P)-dependent dehydrogenase (short-subunit alcohol dehydrogenase family)